MLLSFFPGLKDGLRDVSFGESIGITIGGSLVITGFLTIIGFAVLGCRSPLGLTLGTTVGCLVEGSSEAGMAVVCLDITGSTLSVVGLNVVVPNVGFDAVVIDLIVVGLGTSFVTCSVVDLVVSVILIDGSSVVSVGSFAKVDDFVTGSIVDVSTVVRRSVVVVSTISEIIGSSVVTVTSSVVAAVVFSFSGVSVDVGTSVCRETVVFVILDCGADTAKDDICWSSSEYNSFKSGRLDEYVVDKLSVDDKISCSVIEDFSMFDPVIPSCEIRANLRDGVTVSSSVDEGVSDFVPISDGRNIPV